MPGTVRSIGNTAINKTHKFIFLLEPIDKLGIGEGKQMNK